MNILFDKPWETMGGFCQDPVTAMMVVSTAVSTLGAISEGQAASAEADYQIGRAHV